MGYRIKRLQDMGRALRASRELAEVERWPRERVERLQRERLDAIARHASEHSPFWRERLPRGRVELSALPILTKSQMMERFDELVTDPRLRIRELLGHLEAVRDDALYLGAYRAMTTSGSSGRKGVFVYDRAGWVSVASMFLRRSDWVGVRPRLPRLRLAIIAGGSPTHMSQRGSRSLDVGIHRLCALAATQPLEELVEKLNSFRPQFLNTYPSTGALLAEEQLSGRLRLELEGLTTNSEPLTRSLRERLELAFGVRPTDFYATTEGLYGHECEMGSMHLFDDMCIVENVDEEGDPVPPGEVGSRLLLTNLFNRVQPLIRFEIADMVSLDPKPCPCGRALIRLRSLEGRAEDVLHLRGVAIHPLQFAIVTADPDVREFQVVQQGDSLLLRVALRDGAAGAPERLGSRLGARLSELGVPEPLVRVERVDSLERTPGGKLKLVVANS